MTELLVIDDPIMELRQQIIQKLSESHFLDLEEILFAIKGDGRCCCLVPTILEFLA